MVAFGHHVIDNTPFSLLCVLCCGFAPVVSALPGLLEDGGSGLSWAFLGSPRLFWALLCFPWLFWSLLGPLWLSWLSCGLFEVLLGFAGFVLAQAQAQAGRGLLPCRSRVGGLGFVVKMRIFGVGAGSAD